MPLKEDALDNNGNKEPQNNKSPKNIQTIVVLIIATCLVLTVVSMLSRFVESKTNVEITYTEFLGMIEKKQVKEVYFDSDKIVITPVEGYKTDATVPYTVTYYTGYVSDDTLTQKLVDSGAQIKGNIPNTNSSIITFIIYYVVPILLCFLFLSFMMKKVGGPSFGRSNAKKYDMQKSTGVSF